MSASITPQSRLSPEQVDQVLALGEGVAQHDGIEPLSDHIVVHLRHGGDPHALHFLVIDEGELVAYLHLDPTDLVEGSAAELFVAPSARRHGLATGLIRAALRASPDGRLRLWAHGDHPGTRRLAELLGFARSRRLWQLRRALAVALPVAPLPPGVVLRSFVVGEDEGAWLALNARVFADHPEQGRWSAQDLALREREAWFDSAGFLLAWRGDALVGFHWTKTHGDGGHGHAPLGEIYVLGVAPEEAGRGLGHALSVAGLEYLRGRGLSEAMLFVDAENAGAVALYRSLGFRHWSTGVEYRAR